MSLGDMAYGIVYTGLSIENEKPCMFCDTVPRLRYTYRDMLTDSRYYICQGCLKLGISDGHLRAQIADNYNDMYIGVMTFITYLSNVVGLERSDDKRD